jgi:hypothetical protein
MNHPRETEVCVHGVEVDPIVVVLQPVKQFLVEVELLEAGSGFKDKEKDKLFPRGDGLQIHDILCDVAFRNLGNIFNFFDGGTQGVVGLEVGGRIKHDGSHEDFFHDGNRVDFVVSGKR